MVTTGERHIQASRSHRIGKRLHLTGKCRGRLPDVVSSSQTDREPTRVIQAARK